LPAFTEEDRVLGNRFIKVCGRLAGYTAINCDGRLSYTVRGSTDQFDINVDFPTDEAFTASRGAMIVNGPLSLVASEVIGQRVRLLGLPFCVYSELLGPRLNARAS
jgi:hypothetical protein